MPKKNKEENHDLSHFKNNLVINGSNFYLKNFELKLVRQEYLNWLRDEKVNKYIIKAGKDITIEQVKEYCSGLINSKNNLFLALFTKINDQHIGNVRLGPIDSRSKACQFSMMIGDSRYHGKGMGTEIVSICIKYCFRRLGMQKFFLEVIDDNEAAVKIYQKNGLNTETLLKNHIKLDEQYHDLRIMSLLRSQLLE